MFNTSFYEDKVPEHLLKGLIAWGNKHHPVGDFLTAVLSNNLWDAVARADDDSMKSLKYIVMFIHNELPSKCHGSKELVADWIKAMNKETQMEMELEES
jgi:hypothetical protein